LINRRNRAALADKAQTAHERGATVADETNPRQAPTDLRQSRARDFAVRGTISNADGSAAAGVTVIAFDEGTAGENLLGKSATDTEGAYRITYRAASVRTAKNKRGDANILVRAYDSKGKILAQSATRLKAPMDLKIDVTLPPVRCTAGGMVRHRNGAPAIGLTIIAFDRDLRREEKLGSAATDNQGRYTIAYTTERFRRAESKSADLVIRAFSHSASDSAPPDKALAESPIWFNAPEVAEIDLDIPDVDADLSEFERNSAAIAPLLIGQGPDGGDLPVGSLTTEDIGFVSSDTGIELDTVRLWVASARAASVLLAREAKQENFLSHRTANEVASVSFWAAVYGWFRLGMPQDTTSLLRQPTDILIAALTSAIDKGFVPKSIGQQTDAIRGALDAFKADSQLQASSAGGDLSLGDLLTTLPEVDGVSPLDNSQRKTVAQLWQRYGPTDALWDQMHATGLGAFVPELKRTVKLNDITLGHLAVMRQLQARRDQEAPDSIDYLVQLRLSDWLSLAFENGPPTSGGFSCGSYAVTLQQNVERTLPTQSFGARLASGDIAIDGYPDEKVVAFLRNHSDFEFARFHVEPFLKERNIEDPELAQALIAVQRLQSLTPYPKEIGVLLGAGLDSASRIAANGPRAFAASVNEQIDSLRSDALYSRSQLIASMTINFGTQFGLHPGRNSIAALRAHKPSSATLDRYASLRILFGDQDYCECRDCQSVLGPAAYFADIMHFLEGSRRTSTTTIPTAPTGLLELDSRGSVLEALLSRRSDLADLELSCANTDTEIPYIDLVLEVLENAIALPLDIDIPDNTSVANSLSTAPLADWVRNGLSRTAVSVGKTLEVTRSALQSASALGVMDWVIRDSFKRWTLRHSPHQLLVRLSSVALWAKPNLRDLQDAENALDGLRINAEIEAILAPEPLLPLSGTPRVAPLRVGPARLRVAKSWTVSYTRGCRIRVVLRGDVEVELLSLDGPVLRQPLRYPQNVLQSIVTSLNAGPNSSAIEGGLHYLGLPVVEGARLERNAQPNTWDYTLTAVATFLLPDERLSITSLAYQNSAQGLNLLSAPQNRNPAAYGILSDPQSIHPWSLPFDLVVEETRAFLDALGVSRARLLQLTRPQERWNEPTFVYEVLGTTAREVGLIAPANVGTTPPQWGLQAVDNSVPDRVAGANRTGSWLDVLRWVSMLCQQSGVSFREYLDLLQTHFAGAPQLSLSPPFECKPSEMKIDGLTDAEFEDHLDRIHRFTRLRRRVGWTVLELDLAIAVFGGTLTPAVVQNLGWVKQLGAMFNLPMRDTLAMLKFIDTRDWVDHQSDGTPIISSLYRRSFLRTGLREGAEQALFALTDDGAALADNRAETITDHADYIAAALSISSDDVWLCTNTESGFAVPDKFMLENLGQLLAITTAGSGLQLSIQDLVRLVGITGNNPFALADAARRCRALIELAEAATLVSASGSSLEELDYLLRHRTQEVGALANETDRIAQILFDIRNALRTIKVIADPTRDNLRNQLARLAWPERLIDDVLGDSGIDAEISVEIELGPIPRPAPTIPNAVKDKFSYREDVGANKAYLGFAGTVQAADFAALANVPRINDLQRAYEAFDAASEALRLRMQSFVLPEFRADLVAEATFPAIPDRFVEQVRFESTSASAALVLRGPFPEDDRIPLRDALDALAIGGAPNPVDDLIDQAAAYAEANAANRFVDLALAKSVFGAPDLRGRVAILLEALLPFVQRQLQLAQIAGVVSAATGLAAQSVSRLTDRLFLGPKVFDLLIDAGFIASSTLPDVLRVSFPLQFRAVAKTTKAARLLIDFSVGSRDLDWLLSEHFDALKFINQLPDQSTGPSASFELWRKFADLISVRDQIPNGGPNLALLEAALQTGDKDKYLGALANAFKLETSEVESAFLDYPLELSWNKDYANPTRVLQAIRFLSFLKGLGAQTKTIVSLVQPVIDDAAAAAARSLFCAQFDADGLAERLRPISDRLREAQRAAARSYLQSKLGFDNPEDLFEFYLIDTQMGSCMVTSRLKQAISSVQLFVQRCLLGLEQGSSEGIALLDVEPDAVDSVLWRWMKSYRVWEANREIFLYPENWLEPELLDIKSDLFRQLESNLSQESLTDETIITTVKKFVSGLERVGCVDVMALHLEQRTELKPVALHIVARTKAKPSDYLYRRLELAEDPPLWKPWEAIDVSGALTHVALSALNGAPVLFWLNFLDDPNPKKGADPVADPESAKVQAQVCWVEKVPSGQWSKTQHFSKTFLLPRVQPKSSVESSYAILPTHSATQVELSLFGPAATPLAGGQPTSVIIPDGIVALNQLPTSGVGIGIFVTVETDDGTMVDAKIHIRLTGDPDGMPTKSYNGEIINDLSDDQLDISGGRYFGTGTNAVTVTNTVSTGSRFLMAPLLIGQFSVQILLRDQSYELTRPSSGTIDILDFTTTTLTVTTGRLEYGDVRNRNALIPGKNFHLRVIAKRSAGAPALPPAPKAWRLQQFGTAQLFASGREMASVFDTGGRDFPVAFSLPGTAVLRSWGGSELIDDSLTTGGVYYDLNGQVLQVLGRSLGKTRVVSDFGADSHIGENWTCVQDEQTVYLSHTYSGGSTLDFFSFYVPPVDFLSAAPSAGSEGILRLDAESDNLRGGIFAAHSPTAGITKSPTDSVSFDLSEAYALYYWELFFHAPLLIAQQLSADQQFDRAQRWFHLIFDPMSGSTEDEAVRSWRFKPFHDAGRGTPIDELLEGLARGDPALQQQITVWKHNPFNPHVIARMRIRAYQFEVVIKYIENLIGWGDQLFRLDTIEAINEATQHYVLAAKLLGPRPTSSPRQQAAPKSFRDLGPLDSFSNVWVRLEALLAPWLQLLRWLEQRGIAGPQSDTADRIKKLEQLLASAGSLYFCVPRNAGLDHLWDTVESRLFNIRNCMNIDGVRRQLPLFEPPIDPALLVRATAAGIDLATVLADMHAPMPNHRFAVLLPKAIEAAAEAKAMGASLLSAIEKQDAESLALLRSSQDIAMLKLVRTVKEQQRDEADANLVALRKTREVTAQRYAQYQRLLNKKDVHVPAEGEAAILESASLAPAQSGSGDEDVRALGLTPSESDHLNWLNVANNYSITAGSSNTLSGIFHALPDAIIGITVPATSQVKFGGSHLGSAASATGAFFSMLAANANFQGGRSGTVGGYQRRFDDWAFQSNLAAKELEQIDKQIIASQIRIAVAGQELDNHEQQIRNAQVVDDLMHEKFSNEQLFQWMRRQTSTLYFRLYQLAYDQAKRAESAYRYELGLTDSNFIQYGYWDSLKKGLLAGDQLQADLRRMEMDYLERNKREYEITKHVSLLALAPFALVSLRETGTCTVNIPEALFDLDYPGHYFRRIKSVSLSIPCVTGPYTGVSCTLTLLKAAIRRQPDVGTAYARKDKRDSDSRFSDSFGAIQSIVTSSGQQDGGLFETNLRDERYLPFEGCGAISTWRLELPAEFRAFDYQTISDVILHFRYTARDGGADLKRECTKELVAIMSPILAAGESACLQRLFSLRQEFPVEWNLLCSGGQAQQGFSFAKNRFPFLFSATNLTITITSVDLYVVPAPAEEGVEQAAAFPDYLSLKPPSAAANVQLISAPPVGALLTKSSNTVSVLVKENVDEAQWTFEIGAANQGNFRTGFADIFVICHYLVAERRT
jgi:Tc toxin complex TcA C-terminal TcB-binding domain/Neuraminidase-like domain